MTPRRTGRVGGVRVVIAGDACAMYPQAGGVWSWMLQYVMGLRALGHDVLWIESHEGAQWQDCPQTASPTNSFGEPGLSVSTTAPWS